MQLVFFVHSRDGIYTYNKCVSSRTQWKLWKRARVCGFSCCRRRVRDDRRKTRMLASSPTVRQNASMFSSSWRPIDDDKYNIPNPCVGNIMCVLYQYYSVIIASYTIRILDTVGCFRDDRLLNPTVPRFWWKSDVVEPASVLSTMARLKIMRGRHVYII